MRASATIMGLLALFLTSCGLEPRISEQEKKEIATLKGPNTDTIEGIQRNQAEQAASMGDFKHAAQLYKQLTDRIPSKTEYKVRLADSLRRGGDYSTSLRILDELAKNEPANAEVLEIKGLDLMNMGEFGEAADSFGRVMKIDPKRWRTLNGIGILFAIKGKYDAAILYFQEGLNVSTDNPSVLNNAALTYAINHDYERSHDAFNRARRHLSRNSQEIKHLDLNLALVYAVEGKVDEAEHIAAPHLSKEGLYNNMGIYSYLAKNNEMAKDYLNMALTQSSTYYERAWRNLGALSGTSSTSSSMAADVQSATPDTSVVSPVQQKETGPAVQQLSDIPESKPLQSTPDSPYAGVSPDEKTTPAASPPKVVRVDEKPEVKPVQETAPAAEKAVMPEEHKSVAKPKPSKAADKKEAVQVEKVEKQVQPVADNAGTTAEPKINPDIILLKPPKGYSVNKESKTSVTVTPAIPPIVSPLN